MPSNHTLDYDQIYIEACFFAWYRAGAPGLKTSNGNVSVGGAQVMNSLPAAADGRKPNIVTVSRWAERYGWRQRADALDAEVSVKLEQEVIQERIQTLKTLAQNGKTLKDKGLKFISDNDNPFADNASAAVRAIIAGADMEFKYAGQAQILENISGMTNKQLESEILKLLGKEASELNENEDIVDSTLEDIPSEDDSPDDNDS